MRCGFAIGVVVVVMVMVMIVGLRVSSPSEEDLTKGIALTMMMMTLPPLSWYGWGFGCSVSEGFAVMVVGYGG